VSTCGAVSNQGTVCERAPHAEGDGCHEAFVDGDSRRWWGDARWAPWEWIVYEFAVTDPRRPSV